MKRFTINVGIAFALGLGLTLCLLALLKTAHAAPDDLFAKSDGSGAACTQANPAPCKQRYLRLETATPST